LGFGRGAREEFAGAITFGHAGNHAVHDFLDGKARFRLLFLPVAVIGNAVFFGAHATASPAKVDTDCGAVISFTQISSSSRRPRHAICKRLADQLRYFEPDRLFVEPI
jgi:hypothetical protein